MKVGKVLWQVVHADLHEKTFVESHILYLKSIFEQRHLELAHKCFTHHVKSMENAKLFCLKTFMVYSI